jgi:hypothetical protein
MDLAGVVRIYDGSDGAATLALYAQLEARGPAGVVAMNLFRAQKASSRAKVYRGGVPGKGSYRGMAYDRKAWSLTNLCTTLDAHGDALGLRWGWAFDPAMPGFPWVLYVDLPTGQVSFHNPAPIGKARYVGTWDGVRQASPGRICRWVAHLLGEAAVA